MSKIEERKIDCPSCKQVFSTKIYSSAHTDNPHDRAQIFNDKINVATCPHCHTGIQIDTPLLCVNHKLKFAVWYDPNHDEQIDGAANFLDKALGANNYLLRAPRISNWETVKAKILELEKKIKNETKSTLGIQKLVRDNLNDYFASNPKKALSLTMIEAIDIGMGMPVSTMDFNDNSIVPTAQDFM